MNILMIYPRYPDTFWSFKHALKFISKKAVNPPLGLLTIAAMLPNEWNVKLVDMNVERLRKRIIKWADYIFISAMNIQSQSVDDIIAICKLYNKKIVAGGPLFTEVPEKYKMIDHLVLNEAEITLPHFLSDLQRGAPKHTYSTVNYAELIKSPLPEYGLAKFSKYNTLNLQFTRGCPFDCEFCDITALLGRKVRMKQTYQILSELQVIYNLGWRKNIFFVDDNFIGNKSFLKKELLPAIYLWMKSRNHPFTFSTEASINLADDEELLEMMVKAGFATIFIGIESTEEESLLECGKKQNTNRDIVKCIHKIQSYGLEVTGGFILGFDNDNHSVFQRMVDFIHDSGIISAMVGLLNAPKRTKLYARLKREGRLVRESSGNNTDLSLGFIPKMNENMLIEGYKKVIRGIYGGKEFYTRVLNFIKRFNPDSRHKRKLSLNYILAFIKSIFKLGLRDRFRKEYWELFFWTLVNRPELMSLAITYSVYGYHFRKVFKNIL